jgi:hypothetical protein
VRGDQTGRTIRRAEKVADGRTDVRALTRLFARLSLVFALAFCACAHADDPMNLTILAGNSRIDIVVEEGTLQIPRQDLLKWVQWAADSVTGYYGRFPVPHLSLRIVPFSGKGVRNGRTFGEHGGFIVIHVGDRSTMEDLAADWMLTHEMIHLAFPSVQERSHWIEEGISTYVEPIARVRATHMGANQMWYEVVRDMRKGLPEAGDQGLDHTHTWGRTYWGGALFCLLADVEIHQKTGNKKGLQDALRGVLEAGGDIRQDWDIEKALDAGDHAVGVSLLHPLYNKMKDAPYQVDLPALWKQLGITLDGNTVHFDDSAPLAGTREAITQGAARTQSNGRRAPNNSAIFVGMRSRPAKNQSDSR